MSPLTQSRLFDIGVTLSLCFLPSNAFLSPHVNHPTRPFHHNPSANNNGRTTNTPLHMFDTLSNLQRMNEFNIPVEDAIENWTAVVTQQTAMQDETIVLRSKDDKNLFVDTLRFEIRRSVNSPSLGLELLEIAGGDGREDNLGITVISGVVEGGNADNLGFVGGDSMMKLEVTEVGIDGDNGLDVVEEVTGIPTECLNYDATVDGILSLPSPSEDGTVQSITVTVKRLRRKPKVMVKIQYPPYQDEPDEYLELFAGENLRRAMLTRGVKLNDPFSKRFDSGGGGDCGAEATCGTCVVDFPKGSELLNEAGIQEKQILKKNPRWRFACRAIVGHGMKEGEMTIRVNPRQWD